MLGPEPRSTVSLRPGAALIPAGWGHRDLCGSPSGCGPAGAAASTGRHHGHPGVHAAV